MYLLAALMTGVLGMVAMRQVHSRSARMLIGIPAVIAMGALCVLATLLGNNP